MKTFFLVGLLTHSFTAFGAVDIHTDLAVVTGGESRFVETAPKANKKLVYFWATWCTVCGEKLTHTLPEIATSHKDLAVVTVSLDDEENRAQHYAEKYKIKLPVLYDRSGKLRQELGINAVPYWMTFRKDPGTGRWIKLAAEEAFDRERIERSLR